MLVEKGMGMKDLDLNMIKEMSRRVLGKEVDIPEKVLEVIKEPSRTIGMRRTLGSPNPNEISRMIKDRRKTLDERKKVFQEVSRKVHESEERLQRMVKSLIGRERSK